MMISEETSNTTQNNNATAQTPTRRPFEVPGVVACQRLMNISDVLIYNQFEGNEGTYLQPLPVFNHGIMGTQNVNSDQKGEGATADNGEARNVANPQMTHSAKTHPDATAIVFRFSLNPVPEAYSMTMCSPAKEQKVEHITTFREAFKALLKKTISEEEKLIVCLRFARNVKNGRWIWRNRRIVRSATVEFTVAGQTHSLGSIFEDHNGQPLNMATMPDSPSDCSEAEVALAQAILDGLLGRTNESIEVSCTATLGSRGSFEIFPSQNYIHGKDRIYEKGEASRLLYTVESKRLPKSERKDITYIGQAAIRDQKCSNAIKTIDTWYPEYHQHQMPIPVEPIGANMETKQFLRNDSSSSLFQLLPQIANTEFTKEQRLFLYSAIVRGGVFGAEGKVKEADGEKGKKSARKTTAKAKVDQQQSELGLS